MNKSYKVLVLSTMLCFACFSFADKARAQGDAVTVSPMLNVGCNWLFGDDLDSSSDDQEFDATLSLIPGFSIGAAVRYQFQDDDGLLEGDDANIADNNTTSTNFKIRPTDSLLTWCRNNDLNSTQSISPRLEPNVDASSAGFVTVPSSRFSDSEGNSGGFVITQDIDPNGGSTPPVLGSFDNSKICMSAVCNIYDRIADLAAEATRLGEAFNFLISGQKNVQLIGLDGAGDNIWFRGTVPSLADFSSSDAACDAFHSELGTGTYEVDFRRNRDQRRLTRGFTLGLSDASAERTTYTINNCFATIDAEGKALINFDGFLNNVTVTGIETSLVNRFTNNRGRRQIGRDNATDMDNISNRVDRFNNLQIDFFSPGQNSSTPDFTGELDAEIHGLLPLRVPIRF